MNKLCYDIASFLGRNFINILYIVFLRLYQDKSGRLISEQNYQKISQFLSFFITFIMEHQCVTSSRSCCIVAIRSSGSVPIICYFRGRQFNSYCIYIYRVVSGKL